MQDTLNVVRMVIPNQTFVTVPFYQESLPEMGGVIGLAPLAINETTPFFYNLVEQGLVAEPVCLSSVLNCCHFFSFVCCWLLLVVVVCCCCCCCLLLLLFVCLFIVVCCCLLLSSSSLLLSLSSLSLSLSSSSSSSLSLL
jgi:Eukaryotic aspartyl protease